MIACVSLGIADNDKLFTCEAFMAAAILQISVMLVGILAIVIYSIFEQRRWNEKWPPIDEDEFMARCTPGTSRDIALRVRRIVSDQLGVDYDRVYPEQNFVDDLGCD